MVPNSTATIRPSHWTNSRSRLPRSWLLQAGSPNPRLPAPKIGIRSPKGGETVAFTRDIAPILVNNCVRCHSGNDPKGGLSMETFELLWAGGKSGAVIDPGQLAKSRLWQLAGEQKPFKMPPGDERITRSEWSKLRTWISEGAAFDGSDPKRKLASLVPSEIERRKAELARTSAAELREKRRSHSDEQWRRTFPKTEPVRVENDDFLTLGNVSADRLNEAVRWAQEGLRAAQEFLGDSSKPAFKGGLALFVLKDRNSFDEFSQTVEKREAPAAIHGAAVVTPDLKEAYVVVEDRENSVGPDGGQGRSTASLAQQPHRTADGGSAEAGRQETSRLDRRRKRTRGGGRGQPARALGGAVAGALSAGRLAGKSRTTC